MFSIRGDHKLLSAVITAVLRGPALGSQPVLVYQVTVDCGTSDMGRRKDLRAEDEGTQMFMYRKKLCFICNAVFVSNTLEGLQLVGRINNNL